MYCISYQVCGNFAAAIENELFSYNNGFVISFLYKNMKIIKSSLYQNNSNNNQTTKVSYQEGDITTKHTEMKRITEEQYEQPHTSN